MTAIACLPPYYTLWLDSFQGVRSPWDQRVKPLQPGRQHPLPQAVEKPDALVERIATVLTIRI